MSHVLLLEPNTILAATYQAAFTAHGFTAVAVSGAQNGIHAIDARQPDVIVLELQLPSHNGVEFLHELRSYPEWHDIPVVVHTSLTPVQTESYVSILHDALGVRAVLYKHGTSLAELVNAVKAQLAMV